MPIHWGTYRRLGSKFDASSVRAPADAFARHAPQGKIGHARLPRKLGLRQPGEPDNHTIKQGTKDYRPHLLKLGL